MKNSLFLDKLNVLEKIHSQLKQDNNHNKYNEIERILNNCISDSLNSNIVFSLDMSLSLFFNSDILISVQTRKLLNKFISLCSKNNNGTDMLSVYINQENKLKSVLDVHGVPAISLFLQIRKILLYKVQEKIKYLHSVPHILKDDEYESFMSFMHYYELYYVSEEFSSKISRKKDIIDNYINVQVIEKIQIHFPDFFLSKEELDEINILIPYFAEHVDQIWNALSEKLFHVPKYMWNLIKKKYDV